MEHELLSVEKLRISLKQGSRLIPIVKDISLDLEAGKSLGVVGESGCGKSLLCHALMGLLPAKTFALNGKISFGGKDLLRLPAKELLKIRGKEVSMIFQDPMASLNPVVRVGRQIGEPLEIHTSLTAKEVKARVLENIEKVQLKDPELVYNKYPFELSGGMQQRVMIAQALITKPKLLIADEPTTALDVTVQAEILRLIKDLQSQLNMSLVLVSHNFSMVTHFCDQIMVMYAGQVAEKISSASFYKESAHPYTKALISSIPRIGEQGQKLEILSGVVPLPKDYPKNCRFLNRCSYSRDDCGSEETFVYQNKHHTVACNLLKDK